MVHRTISKAFETSVLRPVTATYADLVTSGNTRILRSKSLRIALAEWSAQLEIHQRLEDHILAPHYLVINDLHDTEYSWVGSVAGRSGVEIAFRLLNFPICLQIGNCGTCWWYIAVG